MTLNYESGLEQVFEVHLVLAGLQELKYNGNGRMDTAILNNLKQISIHAGEKRFSCAEVYTPMNLLALCQYEFMLRKMLPHAKSNEIIRCMKIAIRKIEEVRKFFGCPPFTEKDEVLIVEVPADEENYRALPVEEFADWKGEFHRLLPIEPRMLFFKTRKNMGGFLNYNGEEKPAVEFVMKSFEKPWGWMQDDEGNP